MQGGWDPQDDSGDVRFFEDAYLLDTDTWHWSPAPWAATGTAAPLAHARTGHRCVALCAEAGGAPRAGAAGGGAGASVLVFGGQDADDVRHNDVRQLVLPTART